MNRDIVAATQAFLRHTEEPIRDSTAWTEELLRVLADLYASAQQPMDHTAEWPECPNRAFNRAQIEDALNDTRRYRFGYVSYDGSGRRDGVEEFTDGDLVEDLEEIHNELAWHGEEESMVQLIRWHWGQHALLALKHLHETINIV